MRIGRYIVTLTTLGLMFSALSATAFAYGESAGHAKAPRVRTYSQLLGKYRNKAPSQRHGQIVLRNEISLDHSPATLDDAQGAIRRAVRQIARNPEGRFRQTSKDREILGKIHPVKRAEMMVKEYNTFAKEAGRHNPLPIFEHQFALKPAQSSMPSSLKRSMDMTEDRQTQKVLSSEMNASVSFHTEPSTMLKIFDAVMKPNTYAVPSFSMVSNNVLNVNNNFAESFDD